MRKTIWGVTAAVVVLASGTYLAVQYGVRNPHSWIGRVVGGAGSVGVKASPLVAIRGFRDAPTDEQEQQKRDPNENTENEVDPRRDTRIIEPIVIEMPEPAIEGVVRGLHPIGFLPPEVVENRQAWVEFDRTPELMPYAVEDQIKPKNVHDAANGKNKSSNSWLFRSIQRVSHFFRQSQVESVPANAVPNQNENKIFKAFEFTPIIEWVVPNRNEPRQNSESGADEPGGEQPASQVDPHHHQHSGCPYFGGYRCPGPSTPEPK